MTSEGGFVGTGVEPGGALGRGSPGVFVVDADNDGFKAGSRLVAG